MKAYRTFQVRPFRASPPAVVIVAGNSIHSFPGLHARRARELARKLSRL